MDSTVMMDLVAYGAFFVCGVTTGVLLAAWAVEPRPGTGEDRQSPIANSRTEDER